jgi:CubicO group peptidase (beta-lactamase class C family)
MYKSFPLFFLLLFSFAISFGQNKQDKLLSKKLDQLLSSKFKPTEPGCAVLIARKSEVIYKNAFGSANLELNVPIKPDMVFKIASITKQFTAVAILQLVEQGKISLQDSVQQYIKDFPAKGYRITIENLLTHTSGLKDYLQVDYAATNMERWDMEPRQIIDSFKNIPLEFEPGTKFTYSNTGYFLLGYIIEKISGKSYQAYILDNLLKPLGLKHTYFDTSNIVIPNRVNGYGKDGEVLRNADFWSPTIAYAAGGLLSNTEDLFKWHKGLYAYKILKEETLKKAFTSFKLKDGTSTGYGYGWYLKDAGGIKSIEHSGVINGFLSNEIYYPAEDVFITTLFNSDGWSVFELSIKISEWVLGKSFQPDIKISDLLMNSYVGTYSLTIDTTRTVIITKENGHLVAAVSGATSFTLVFESETKFQFKSVLDAKCEFIKEKGRVTKFVANQNGIYEWIKIK